jgi:hypothetical protein
LARKPESVFIDSIHRFFPSRTKPWREKMNNPFRSGCADMWYSGNRDCWIEYKYVDPVPRVVTPDLSPRQLEWCNGRYDEGRQVFVIVGCKKGGVVYTDKEWAYPLPRDEFLTAVVSREVIANFILRRLE